MQTQKLTKEFLMMAAAGKYLASCCGNPSVFAEPIAPLRERGRQWKRIVFAKANGRNCWVFDTEAEYRAMMRRLTGSAGLN